MTDLQTLLDRAVDHHVDLDPAAAVRRGHAALRRRRRRVVAGVVAAAVLVVGGTTAYARPDVVHLSPSHSGPTTARAGSFEIPSPPDGWSVQGADENLVVIAPDGLPKVNLHDPSLQLGVMGKLSIALMRGKATSGRPVTYDGRTFYDNEHAGGDSSLVSVDAPSGGVLVLQGAPSLHWTLQQKIQYLDGVVPLPGAVPDSD
jgi:hypothetical protein